VAELREVAVTEVKLCEVAWRGDEQGRRNSGSQRWQ